MDFHTLPLVNFLEGLCASGHRILPAMDSKASSCLSYLTHEAMETVLSQDLNSCKTCRSKMYNTISAPLIESYIHITGKYYGKEQISVPWASEKIL